MITVLDVCCGGRAMWFDRQDSRAVYLDCRRETVTEILPGRTQDVVIAPDMLANFTKIPFLDNSFSLVVMDPPHVQREEMLGNITKRYGCLNGDWMEMLRQGFAECFRVLKPAGTLIFKWSSVQFPIKDIFPLAHPYKPLFGHQSGKRMNTHWFAFIKQSSETACNLNPLAPSIRKQDNQNVTLNCPLLPPQSLPACSAPCVSTGMAVVGGDWSELELWRAASEKAGGSH